MLYRIMAADNYLLSVVIRKINFYSAFHAQKTCHCEAFFAEATSRGNNGDCFVAKNAPLNYWQQFFSLKIEMVEFIYPLNIIA
jgi:hypothetical protein